MPMFITSTKLQYKPKSFFHCTLPLSSADKNVCQSEEVSEITLHGLSALQLVELEI